MDDPGTAEPISPDNPDDETLRSLLRERLTVAVVGLIGILVALTEVRLVFWFVLFGAIGAATYVAKLAADVARESVHPIDGPRHVALVDRALQIGAEMLVRVARRLGLHESDVSQLEALLRAATGGASAAGAPPPQDRLADAYAALGVTPESSATEIKRAYRKLISQNHPDKLAARGLPESMRAVA